MNQLGGKVLLPFRYRKKEIVLKALFLAGGMGTRLRPLTDHLPKPMVPVMGIPLLERSIDELKRCGVNEVILSTCYESDCISQHFSTGEKSQMKIHCICEKEPLGTGGAIKNCQKYFDDTFLIFNSDILCNIDLKALVQFHREKHSDVTIAAAEVKNPSSYGVIEHMPDGKILSFTEKPKPGEEKSHDINAGIYVFEPRVLDMIPAGKSVSVERDTFPLLLKNGFRMNVYRIGGYWIDIGTPEKYMKAHKDIFNGACTVHENDFRSAKVYGADNADIASSAKITGPVWLGKNIHIGENAVIGPNAVLGDGFQAGQGCEVRNSVIWNGVTLGNGVNIDHSVVTSDCSLASGICCENTIYSSDSKLPFA